MTLEEGIANVKSNGIEIGILSINDSDPYKWVVKNSQLVPPLSCIKGLGESAIEQIITNRPFSTLDELLINQNILYNKLNKKGLDVLCRSGALKELLEKDTRFNGDAHLWATIFSFDRKSKKKKLEDFIEETKADFSTFSKEQIITNLVELTGVFPVEMIATQTLMDKLKHYNIPPISEYDEDLKTCWFIPREVIVKTTGTGKTFYIVKCTDSSSAMIDIKLWQVNEHRDVVYTDRVWAAKLQNSETWGFSSNGGLRDWKLLS